MNKKLPKSAVNEDSLFRHIKYFFENPEKVLLELVQNSQRAGATRVDLNFNKKNLELELKDNGSGISSTAPLVILSEIQWKGKVKDQMPAGWGLFYLYSLSTWVEFKSLMGRIKLYSQKFLYSKKYRENFLSSPEINERERGKGFYLRAKLKDAETFSKLKEAIPLLRFMPLDIYVDGKLLPKEDFHKARDEERYIIRNYKGNKVIINLETNFFFKGEPAIGAIWYGIPVNIERSDLSTTGENLELSWFKAVVVVKEGQPLTPVLPYRNRIKKDKKLRNFLLFLWQEIKQELLKRLKTEKNEKKLVSLWDTLFSNADRFSSQIGPSVNISQSEIESIGNFPAEISSSLPVIQNCEDPDCLPHSTVFFKGQEGEIALCGDAVVKVSGNILPKDWEPVVPDDWYKFYFINENEHIPAPSWLKKRAKRKNVLIEITPEGEPYQCRYLDISIQKAKIRAFVEGKEKELHAVAAADDNDGYGFTIYYRENPEDIQEIANSLFNRYIYTDDGDSYSTQEYEFEKELRIVILKAKKQFPLITLLGGFISTGLISADEVFLIKSIKVGKNEITVELPAGEKRIRITGK